MESRFVILARYPSYTNFESQLDLNILEMWGAVLFQTLRRKALPKWLPPSIEIRLPFVGVNIALPLSQSMRAIQECENPSGLGLPVAIASTTDGKERNSKEQDIDAMMNSWQRRSHSLFQALRDSPDPKHREYYALFHKKL